MRRVIYLTALIFWLYQPAISEAEKRVLVDKEIEVLRGDMKQFHFLVPKTGGKVQFKGEFKTTGGFNDDITLLVLTQENYVRWYSKYNYQTLSKIERKREGKFIVDAEPGQTYYFVFDNFFSTVSNKKVKFRLEQIQSKN